VSQIRPPGYGLYGMRCLVSRAYAVYHIRESIANWNAECKPFAWTVDADTIPAKVRWTESELHKLTGH
jgi:hypothetical protein